jgi:PAS domain S-box-containing protein
VLHLDETELEQSQERLELALAASRLGVWEWRLDSGKVLYSARAREIFGFDPTLPLTIDTILNAVHPDDRERVRGRLQAVGDPAYKDQQQYEFRILRPDGELRNVVAIGKVVFGDGAQGLKPVRHVGTLADVTEHRRLETELGHSHATLRVALQAARLAVWEFDLVKRQVTLTPGLKKIFGFDPNADVDIDDVRSRYHRADIENAWALGRAAVAAGEPHFEAEFRFRCPDQTERWYQMRAEVFVDADGAMSGVVGVVLDITQRKHADDRLRFLAREVDHRANNLLAVIQGAVALSKADTAEDLREVILGRVQALARAHQLIAESRWEGADLRRIVEEELRPYALGDSARVTIEGETAPISATAAQCLGMAVHELATNAVKYGALSSPSGRISVRWRRTGADEIQMCWKELVAGQIAEPANRGFGLSVIHRSLQQIKGSAVLEWKADGLLCQLTFAPQDRPAV